jgi:hypothetical protein
MGAVILIGVLGTPAGQATVPQTVLLWARAVDAAVAAKTASPIRYMQFLFTQDIFMSLS